MDGPGTTSTITHLEIDGRDVVLSGEHDVLGLMQRIEDAARTEPTFVDLVGTSGLMSVLITARTKVVVSVEEVDPSPTLEPIQAPYLDWDG